MSHKIEEYWEDEIKKNLETRKNEMINEINRLTTDIEKTRKNYEELKNKIELHNKLLWEETTKRAKNRGSTTHILWVDDNPTNNSALIEMFEENGIFITTTTNNEETIRFLKSQNVNNRVNLIITDIERFGDKESGIELLKILKSNHYHIPTIVFTSPFTDDKILAAAKQLGAKLTTSSPKDLIQFVNDLHE